MLNRTHAAIAREIRSRVRSYDECHPMGCTHDESSRLESETMQASHAARYLAQHLAGVNRAEFLKACGIRPD